MNMPPFITSLMNSNAARAIFLTGLAAVGSQLAATNRPDSDSAMQDRYAVNETVSSLPASNERRDSEADASASDTSSDRSQSTAANRSQSVLPVGLRAADGPVRPTSFGPTHTARTYAAAQPSQSPASGQSRQFKTPTVRKVKPWFGDGPVSPDEGVDVTESLEGSNRTSGNNTEPTWESDSALMRTDDPYYDGRFTTKELDEINRIRVMDRDGKLEHADKLVRVRNWIEELDQNGNITPQQGEIYDVRLDHAEYLFEEATPDGNLEPSKPVSVLRQAASTILDFVPVVGNVKSAYEAIVGVDPITGEELSALDRAASAGSVLLPGLKTAKKGISILRGVVKYGDEAIELEKFATKLAKANKTVGEVAGARKKIVVGENMARVKRYAKKYGAEIYDGPADLETNRRWIQKQMAEGAEVIDIGPHFERRVNRLKGGKDPESMFYRMERQQTKGYSGYRKNFDRRGRLQGRVNRPETVTTRKAGLPSRTEAGVAGKVDPQLGAAERSVGSPDKTLKNATPNTKTPLRYELGPNDVDWRQTGKTAQDALDDAFTKTGIPKSEFEVTKWGKDKYGKSHPVEWRHKNGAEVNIDWPHAKHGPDAPHVGWQTGGKRGGGGGKRGHTILDDVPYNR